MISGYSAFGTSGIQLLRYRITPLARIPSTWVNIQVMKASASVTDRVEVAAKIASVGTATPAMCTFSSDNGSGMNPSMLTTQMKIIRLAQYGNQVRIALAG